MLYYIFFCTFYSFLMRAMCIKQLYVFDLNAKYRHYFSTQVILHKSNHFFLFFLPVNGLIGNLKYQILFQHLLQYLRRYLLFLIELWSCMYSCCIILFFLHMSVLRNHTKTHALLFCWYVILLDLNKLVYSWTLFFHFYEGQVFWKSFYCMIV